MARISGIDLPPQKRVVISLQYIYGIGKKSAHDICARANVDLATRTKDLTEEQTRGIREIIESNYKVEGDLRREVTMNIKRLMDLGCFRGLRHRRCAASAPTPMPGPGRARSAASCAPRPLRPPRGPDPRGFESPWLKK